MRRRRQGGSWQKSTGTSSSSNQLEQSFLAIVRLHSFHGGGYQPSNPCVPKMAVVSEDVAVPELLVAHADIGRRVWPGFSLLARRRQGGSGSVRGPRRDPARHASLP